MTEKSTKKLSDEELKKFINEALTVGETYTIISALSALQDIQDKYQELADFLQTPEAVCAIICLITKTNFDWGNNRYTIVWNGFTAPKES